MSEYNDGDILTLEHPNGSRLIGVVRGDAVRIEEEYYAHTISTALRHGFTITNVEKPAPELPTAPGLYVPTNNQGMLSSSHIYRLSNEWSILTDPSSGPNEAESRAAVALKNLGGLTRLVPEV